MRLRYDPALKTLARELRNKSTLAEVLLWKHLKGRQRRGCDFHRQRPVDRYIVDFFAPKLMLAVEIDGDTHRFKSDEDAERQRRLESLGIRFLRFGDLETKQNTLGVVAVIDAWIDQHSPDLGRASSTHPGASRTPLARGDSITGSCSHPMASPPYSSPAPNRSRYSHHWPNSRNLCNQPRSRSPL